ncbi:hypothetical protein FRC07_008243 [Ceratobasidium sp. 392]|nr:hypothetical protein FRC07_008243 [Ceratobasidium sp. 392]
MSSLTETSGYEMTTMISAQHSPPSRLRETGYWQQGRPTSSSNPNHLSSDFLIFSTAEQNDISAGSSQELFAGYLGASNQAGLLTRTRNIPHRNTRRTLGPLSNLIPERGDEEWDPDGAVPVIRRSMTALGNTYDPDFRELCNFYLKFIGRYFYDCTLIHHNIIAITQQRFVRSISARHGMLSLAFLFRSNYDQPHLASALHNFAQHRYQLASDTLRLDLERSDLSPAAKLTSLSEVMTYDYYSGNFPFYYQRLRQAASLVQLVVGDKALDLMDMGGEETLDVRIVAWCDILGSMAASRPTLLNYKQDFDLVQHYGNHSSHDAGLEWIFGCPDVLAVILARISCLRHASPSRADNMAQAWQIEEAIRSWNALPRVSKRSSQTVARLGVQEIWRHTALLYLHQAVYQSDSNHHLVKDSVKQIIRIASTLTSGHNPDCFLAVPYFIAGSFAASITERHQLRTRILGCGHEQYLQDLVDTLDELWRESDATGRHVTWSIKQPPTFIF